ncbi:Cof-type HAD-IIB family hydrolase [Rhodococcus sp. IEGM 1370]|uniref:HAD family hydrolase n=1 Tax=Rhodococcus sp. IEGM 1370 TaxID=3082222 RepID=UPI002953E2F1|nr:Cof-type HAD-IIB family hydrolase [Rhodococcus sp. IEGM 1370]MDV8078226.1 Cof-type HAD-IIB family hydrolase [Rhodococcus sp. IEGM 1370]
MKRTEEVVVVATDLDGTLLRSDRTVSARTAAAMAAADAAGIRVVWATARARHSIDELAASCGFRGTAIGANGAVVLDLSDGSPAIVGTRSVPAETVASAKSVVRSLVPGVAFATVGATRFVAEARYAELCVFADHHRQPHEMELSEHGLSIDVEPTVKIVARHSDTTSEKLYEIVAAAGVDGVELTHSGAPYIEMSAAGVSKASALQELCEQWGISAGSVAAVGDARNDLPMLTWAGTALCPSNAVEPVRSVVDRVLESNDDDAVARYLEELTARRTKL